MAMRATVFPWTPEVASLAQPFYATEAPDLPGVPIGINMRTRKVVYLEPWLLQSLGIINSCRGTVLGEVNHGKSTLLKILMIRLMMLAAGQDKMRGLINNHKSEGGKAEYDKLSNDLFESDVFRLMDHKVNYLDQAVGITASDSLEMVQTVAEFVGGKPLAGWEPFAMQLAIFSLLRHGDHHATPQKAEEMLLRIDKSNLDDFFETSHNELLASVRERQEREKLLASINGYEPRDLLEETKLIIERPHNLPLDELQKAAAYCATLLAATRGGTFGGLFGDGESLSDVLSQDVVTLDWIGVPDRAKSLLRTVLRIIRISAIARNDLRFLPYVSLQDELSQSMEDPVYAKWAAHDSKMGRGFSEVELSSTHRYDDFRKGGVGSQLYGYGESLINDNSFTFLGRQPNDPKVLAEIQQRHNLSTSDVRYLTRIPRHCFGMCLGDRKVVWVRVFVMPSELPFIGTSGATAKMLDRIPVMESPQVLERLSRRNGVEFLGVDDGQ